ncbi:glycosyl hydrolase family 18 protein [Cohnella sp. JJ-181]|uniref:glycosyl hydrolase family 18 protein n=1 Tax=Cohnella rhizoplanae TaxID=2974897 RepID=UPI00232CC37A|nr:glycosyl hydrolase family 18 protein [Cohnella sp. JJ-181]
MANAHPIMEKGEWTGDYALGEGEGLWIPLPLAKELIGDGVRYEAATESVILTSDTSVMHFKTGKLSATLNSKPFNMSFGAKKTEDGTLYLPFAPIQQLFGLAARTDAGTGIVSLLKPGTAIQSGEVSSGDKGAKLRQGSGKSQPIVQDLKAGATVVVWGEDKGWYRVQSTEGHLGYMSKKDVALRGIEEIPSGAVTEQNEPYVPWKVTGKRINLTWDAIYNVLPDPAKIGDWSGVNVVSPSWFSLTDGKGNIQSKADAAYAAWARNKGMQVWAMFSNSFEPDRTHEALASYASRNTMIQQLIAYARTFRVQGINLDFENVYTKDKDNLIQFVRELTPIMHEQGVSVSIDVTPKSNSEMWSAYLDRGRLAAALDYLILMAYDEHWAASPVSGSVASLPWTENAVSKILKEDGVAPEKLILGIPFYTRVWTEKTDAQGKVEVSSKAIGMDAARKLIEEKKLKPALTDESGQHYAEFKENGTIQRIWFENESSVQARVQLVKKYKLAGVASWNRAFAAESIWSVLDKALQSYP